MNSIDKINVLLAKLGKTGADLEREIGVSASVYSQWNTGRTAPSKKSLVKVAAALNVPVESILPDINETKKEPVPISENELDLHLIELLTSLTPDEMRQVDAFVQGLLAARKA